MNGHRVSVRTEGLIKEYHIYDHPLERLKEVFLKARKHRVFRALGPLDIEVRKGETIGIIGENGAGKSTFLKLVAGVIEPSSGTIEVNGKVSSILELGTGFNPEFTGRENVLLNGALLGLSSGEINDRMESIARFADIGEFLDIPVKTYSSGMYMRLAFSLAVHVDADIIVIDEALTVGDGAFEKKCIDRIWDLKKRGITILYCSHSLYTVVNFCDRAVWVRGGSVQCIGEAKEVVSIYEDYLREKEGKEKAEKPIIPADDSERKIAAVSNIRITADGHPVETSLQHSSDVEVTVDFEILEDLKVHVGFAIDRNDGICCYADSTQKQGIPPFQGPGSERIAIRFKRLPLLGGAYKFVIFLLDETGICLFDRRESTIVKVHTIEKEWGICHVDHEWMV
jgi:ABC-type polysaccharide/polyol phosphate transport system ATPase subunit